MSDRMYSIPFKELMEWMLGERKKNTVFGVHRLYKADPNKVYTLFDRAMETPFGPAAGPHTQLAQNIAAAYAAGSRFFELKTVQQLDGENLVVEKPCIKADDECYNVEWSTELTVEKALEEYVKAWFLCHVLAIEYGLGSPKGFQFNMSCGYDLEGIKTPKIDGFINALKDASQTEIFRTCKAWLLDHMDAFTTLTKDDVEAIPGEICNSITLSTMHGCPPEEIERIASHLIDEKGLNTYVKCNPTLLGYEVARKAVDDMGYTHLVFNDSHFKDDLQFSDAVPMIKRLQERAAAKGLLFGVKLTNTFPVDITRQELPGNEMYMSGKPLLFLSMNVAKKLTEAFDGQLRMSYSGGADAFTIKEIVDAGIWPVTVATTLLKPGGYDRLYQLAELFAKQEDTSYDGVHSDAVDAVLEKASTIGYYKPLEKKKQNRKSDHPLPLTNCFTAPCADTCPIHQDIPAYMELVKEGRYSEALEIILEKNPLPFITGTVCYHTCMNSCTRNFYEDAVEIRRNKLIAAENGYEQVLEGVKETAKNGKKALIIGAGPAGLAAAYFLNRGGVDATIYEKSGETGGMVRSLLCHKMNQITGDAIDKDVALIEKAGVHIELNKDVTSLADLQGFDYVVVASGVKGKIGDSDVEAKDNVYVIGDKNFKKTTSVVECIADGMAVAEKILAAACAVDTIIPVDHIYEERGTIETAPKEGCDGRCLHCEYICEACCEVCPNRANVSIDVPELAQHQIIHVDAVCNECGNCRSFCPWGGAPYLEKLTLFRTEEDMKDSKNPGFYVVDRKTGTCLVRLNGETVTYRASAEDMSIPKEVGYIIDAVLAKYDYLLL